LKITNCTECKYHKVIPDPDLTDSFNRDDVAVVCIKMQNDDYDPKHKYIANRQKSKLITVACRPYHVKKESSIPDWCPLELIEKVDKF
jgi:hypothetical protein